MLTWLITNLTNVTDDTAGICDRKSTSETVKKYLVFPQDTEQLHSPNKHCYFYYYYCLYYHYYEKGAYQAGAKAHHKTSKDVRFPNTSVNYHTDAKIIRNKTTRCDPIQVKTQTTETLTTRELRRGKMTEMRQGVTQMNQKKRKENNHKEKWNHTVLSTFK